MQIVRYFIHSNSQFNAVYLELTIVQTIQWATIIELLKIGLPSMTSVPGNRLVLPVHF